MPVITRNNVVAALGHVVRAKGRNYVYEQPPGKACSYADGAGEPSCIVGHAFALIAPEVFARFRTYEEGRVDSFPIDSERAANLICEAGYELEPSAVTALTVAQTVQDDHYPWGAALVAVEAIE